MYHIGQKAICTMPNGDKFECVIDEIREDDEDKCIIFKITTWEHEGKYSVLYKSEIDNNIQFLK